MIQIICRQETYVYNAYHIVKAFYPSEDVSALVEEKASNYVTVHFEKKDAAKPSMVDICVEAGDGAFLDKRQLKNRIDKELYRALSMQTGRKLAWGILTGVRPTKIAMRKLEERMAEEAFIPWFTEQSLVSPGKAALAWEIAKREKALLDRLDYEDGYSLYVGIPFCPSVCTYCSFSSGALSDWKERVDEYLDALIKELVFIADVSAGKRLNTIYIGGGTPTTLDVMQLEKLLTCIDEHFGREYLLEYTVEAGRPDSITREKLTVLKNHGITRISVNPQSMQQKTLDRIGRKHTVNQIRDAYQMARNLGFDNINMDIIAGLPGEISADMEDTLRQIRDLAPDSLTVHSLAIKRAAKMAQERQTQAEESAQISEMIELAKEAAREMGLSPYYLYRQKNIAGNFENVGYAKVDKAGIYNILIMEEIQSILAAGAGASTKIVLESARPMPGSKKGKLTKLIRQENVKAVDAYINRVDEMIERKGEWLWR